MKRYIVWGLVVVLVFSVGFVLAAKPDVTPPQANQPEGRPSVGLPPQAIEVAPNVFYLGSAIDQGRVVDGYAIIDYKKGYGKPGTNCGDGFCEPGENANKCPEDCGGGDGGEEEPDTSSCYTFLAKGAKWKTIEPYVVDPSTEELDETFIKDNLAYDISKWEEAAGKDILGDEISGTVDRANIGDLTGKNEVMFADIDEPGAIAITIIWGTFTAPPPFRELVEWDQVYDDVDFDWSSTGENGTMDFENIATHELGHSVGLGDLYTVGCSEQTMYGYAVTGETKKRSLEDGDITGVQTLYQ